METNEDPIEEKSNILNADFGGYGARQTLGAAMKDVEHFRSAFIVCISDCGEVAIYQSEMEMKDLALIGMKVQGYVLGAVNGWLEEE